MRIVLLHGNHTHMVFIFKNMYAYDFYFKKDVCAWFSVLKTVRVMSLFEYGF